MADEFQYSSDAYSNKRKYEEQNLPPPSSRRPTGFSSAPIPSASPNPTSVPPPMDDIQIAKQKAQEIAARLLNSADAKRPRNENGASYDFGDKGFGSYPSEGKQMSGVAQASIPVSYGSFQGNTKKIEIPNTRVGVIIGKGGETIKYLQLQSGAKIQITRDTDADPNSSTRSVDLTGTSDQISKAEQLINDVLQEAEAGGSGGGGRRMGAQAGSDQFVMKIPNNKVGLIIGKGGETIKSMQAQTGARIQVIPLHLPPGDPTPERTLQIDGITDQIEHAKQLVNEIISGENRMRNSNSSMGGGYPQQGGYQARQPSSWAPPGVPPAQPGYGGYMQQGAYPGPPQYGQSAYGTYPQQTSAGYSSTWDQSSVPPSHQSGQGEYDYYGQQQPQQPSSGGSSAPPTDTTGYNYYQHAYGYGQAGQGYQQDGYGAYNVSQQPGYGQATGYDQQGGHDSTTNPTQEEDTSKAAPASSAQSGQAGYGTSGQHPPAQGSNGQAGYGAAPNSQAGNSSQPPVAYNSGYGAPPPASNTPAHGQNQQLPGAPGSYGSQSGYAQPAASGYGPTYGYGEAPQAYGSYEGYTQPDAPPAPPSGPPKASPKS